jgi:hypothetical protein
MLKFSHPDFGIVSVTVNPRARNITMRPKVDGLRVTVPNRTPRAFLNEVLDKHRTSLLEGIRKCGAEQCTTDEEVERLRREAKAYLPRRVNELAYMYGFNFKGLKIQSSKTRWGSCSGTNNINLSLYLMRVPEHLQDYVILHELCHTVHHNHSHEFWALLDKVSNGKALALRKELRGYTTA